MSDPVNANSRVHDLFTTVLGGLALVVLISLPWNVDTSGPDPFYKGPLIFPLLVLGLMITASLPAAWRLVRPAAGSTWRLDGAGFPRKTLVILLFLVAYLFSMVLVGLEISIPAFLFCSLFYLGHRSPLKLILITLITSLLVVVTFKYFLEVWFPTPVLWDLFME